MVMQATYKQATQKQATQKQATQKWAQSLWMGLTYLLVFLLVFPVLWMVITGVKTQSAAYSPTPTLIFQPTLDHFTLALTSGFRAYLPNSVIASVVSTASGLLLWIPPSYSLVFVM